MESMNNNNSTPDFSLKVDGVKGHCPAGEKYATENIEKHKIPVLSCEGPCIRGEIARLAANITAKESRYARSCFAETFVVPHSLMARWVKESDKIVMIDGCFLKCMGRILNNFVNIENIIHIDALPLYKKYGDVFLYDDVPETERNEVAQQVAEKTLLLIEKEFIPA